MRHSGNGLGNTAKYMRRATGGSGGNGPGTTIKYLRRTARGAEGSSLGTTIKYARCAAGNDLSTAAKYLRGTTGNGQGVRIKYLRRTTGNAACNGLDRCQGLLIRPFITSSPLSPCFMRASFANKQNSTAENWGLCVQCLCVEPENPPCVR